MRFSLIIFFLALAGVLHAQIHSEILLDESLSEISGIGLLDESTMIAINDGGNKPEFILMDLKGNIQRKVLITNGSNEDWEDLTVDDEYVYAGDFGNNLNNRKNLIIYRVLIADILKKDVVSAEKIKYRYDEQKQFPPSADSLFYDVEGMCHFDDSLWLFTKNRSNGDDKDTWVYVIPKTPGDYNISRKYKLNSGRSGWWSSGITAADADGKFIYLMTYDKVMVFERSKGALEEIARFEFITIGQRESLLKISDAEFLIADEKNSIFGEAKLYSLHWDFINE